MARRAGSHSEITGPRVRQAALRLFARHGYAAVSMRQIASEVGVQAGALYGYTAGKQGLLFDLMRSHMEDVLAGWADTEAGLAGPADPGRRLAAFVRFHIGFHLDRPDAVFVAYMELRNLSPENFAAVSALRGRYEKALEDILRDGAACGAFRLPDARLATMALIAMLTGVGTWYREGGRFSRDRVTEIYLDMVRRAVGIPG